eukprot:gene6624-7317_t
MSSNVSNKDGFDFLVTLVFIFVAVILLFPLNIFVPLDRRMGALLGAVLCMLFIWSFPRYHNVNIGQQVDFSVLIILSSIMAINFVLLRQPWIKKITGQIQYMIREDVDRGFYAVSLVALFASPFITNDGLCLMLVHPVLDAFAHETESLKTLSLQPATPSAPTASTSRRLCPSDALFFMLNIACSANIGSSLTYTGNPQNIIVARYLGNYMNGGIFCIFMILPVGISWIVSVYVLNYFRKRAAAAYQSDHSLNMHHLSLLDHGKEEGDEEDEEKRSDHGQEMTVISPLQKHVQREEGSELDCPSGPVALDEKSAEYKHEHEGSTLRDRCPPVHQEDEEHGSRNGLSSPREGSQKIHNDGVRWDVVNAPYIVFTALVVIMVLEFTGVVPLAGLFAFTSVMVVTGAIGCNYYLAMSRSENTPQHLMQRIHIVKQFLEDLFHELDYNLLIIFIGLFVVSGSFLLTGTPQAIWTGIAGQAAFTTSLSTFTISIYIILASQLIGNVPVVFMAVDNMIELPRKAQIFGWLMMAFVSTVAGNFTLVGSAANIIVVEKAMRHKLAPIHVDAVQHFKYCCLLTVICIGLGAVVLYIEAELFL